MTTVVAISLEQLRVVAENLIKFFLERPDNWISLFELELLYCAVHDRYFDSEEVGPLRNFVMYLCARRTVILRQALIGGMIYAKLHQSFLRNTGSRRG